MVELENTSEEIENYIFTKRKLLISAKISFILFILIGLVKEYFQTLDYRIKYKMTWLEWNSLQALVVLLVILPIVFMPLHKFIKDRIMNTFVWNIKHSIFENILNQYQCEYKITINACLPDIDIERLQLEKGWVSFVYGNDLIFGTINNVRFRMSEMHSNGFFKRYFDGIIVVLVFDHLIDLSTIEKVNLPQNSCLKVIENKVYLLFEGENKHFELKIKKKKTNVDALKKDYQYFDEIISVVNRISLEL